MVVLVSDCGSVPMEGSKDRLLECCDAFHLAGCGGKRRLRHCLSFLRARPSLREGGVFTGGRGGLIVEKDVC